MAKTMIGDSKQLFDIKMKALACEAGTSSEESSSEESSSVANFLSVGLMTLCSLLKL